MNPKVERPNTSDAKALWRTHRGRDDEDALLARRADDDGRATDSRPRAYRGYASSAWTLEDVRARVDLTRVADAHVCARDVVDLAGHRAANTKRNFEFRAMTMGELLARANGEGDERGFAPIIARGERYYLRSVNGKVATDLRKTHPALAEALDLREMWPAERFHSSVLRVSSPATTLWMHYDTHDNLLVQIVGRKRVALFPPEMDPYMYAQGSSSRVEDISYPPRSPEEYAKFPLFYDIARASRVDFVLEPGDALFIPAFWYHHVYAEADSPSVAVNVFWRSLEDNEYDAKDIYGNKDLRAGKDAVDAARRAGEGLRHLPEPYKSFYARRATQALAEQCGLKIVAET